MRIQTKQGETMKQVILGWRWWVSLGLGLLLRLAVCQVPGAVVTTTVQDTVYSANGTPAGGTILLSWGAFTTAGGESIAAGSTSVTLGANGALSVALAPNAGATPMGSYYTAVLYLNDGTVSRQYWVVPLPLASGAPVKLASIQNQVLPTSVAMQTVSKQYVDNAIAQAKSGFPVDASPYVLKAGDTMTGPLVLAADPVSPLQAADKNYVDGSIAASSLLRLGGPVTAANFALNTGCAGAGATITNVAGYDSDHYFLLTIGAGGSPGNCVLFTFTYTLAKNHVPYPVTFSPDESPLQGGPTAEFADLTNTQYIFRQFSAMGAGTQLHVQVVAP
jgi:hypothetical protein